jgi:hypothetical protein
MLARETGGQGCLRLVVRITTGKTEEIEAESSLRGVNQFSALYGLLLGRLVASPAINTCVDGKFIPST